MATNAELCNPLPVFVMSPTQQAIDALFPDLDYDPRSPSGWRLGGRVISIRAMVDAANERRAADGLPPIPFPGLRGGHPPSTHQHEDGHDQQTR